MGGHALLNAFDAPRPPLGRDIPEPFRPLRLVVSLPFVDGQDHTLRAIQRNLQGRQSSALHLCLLDRGAPDGAWPTRRLLPGVAVNTAVTQADIAETICLPGWATTIRPPENYTHDIKRRQLREAGHTQDRPAGGAPADPPNLWLEPRRSVDGWTARKTDRLERLLNRLVWDGELPLREAQAAIAEDWRVAYSRFVGGGW